MKFFNAIKIGIFIEAVALTWLIICIIYGSVVPDICAFLFNMGMVITFGSIINMRRKQN